MKALILKDFYVLRRQFWLYALVIIAFQAMGNVTAGFITVLYASLLPATAFAYDDQSKWDAMELMLPYSVRQIVLSRYCVGWGGAFGAIALGGLAQRLMSIAPWVQSATGRWEFGSMRLVMAELAFALILLALTMPVYFRYDAQKSRIVRTLMLALLCGGTGAGIALLGIKGVAYPDEIGGSVWALYPLAAVLTAVSIPLSMLAWKRRHR